MKRLGLSKATRTQGEIKCGEWEGGVVGWEDQCGSHRFHRAAPWRRTSASVCKAPAGIKQNLLNIKHQAPEGYIF